MWETIITIMLKVLGWYLDYSKSSDEAKKAYLNFIKEMESHVTGCVRLRESYEAQKDYLLNGEKKND